MFGYGKQADSARLLSEIADVERRPPLAETVVSLLSIPFPTPDEARAIIGEWLDDVWMNPDEPRRITTLFEGKLEGDRISGTGRFGGINFIRPDGSLPPPLFLVQTRG